MRFLALLALTLVAPGVFAQGPDDEPNYDPEVTQAQATQPGRVAPPGEFSGSGSGAVADPATPVVRIQVRAPAHLAPDKPLVYRVIVSNPSSATAYRVVVRHPAPPEGVNFPPVAEPQPKTMAVGAKEMTWEYSELKPGASKEITLTYTMQPDAKSITAKAFVGFEHGQAVTTEPEKPKVTVTKSAPEKANGTEPIAVRVVVKNVSRVAVRNLEVLEDISKGFDYVADNESEATNIPGQRSWRIKELAPGQSRTIEYRVRAKGKGVEFVATSNVRSGDVKGLTDPAKSVTRVLTPDLQLDVTGPATRLIDEPADYVIKVTNSGNTTLNSVRVVADIPADCAVKKLTNGGRKTRDQLIWDVPGDRRDEPLGPGQPYELRFTLVGSRPGVKKVAVNADGGRGVEQAKTVSTTFAGVAALKYGVELAPGTVVVGSTGSVKYSVRNSGTQDAKNVVLRVKLPPNVELKQATPPKINLVTGEAEFEPQTALAGGELLYLITYTAKTPGRALFAFKLTADGEATPWTAERSVTIEPANP